MFHFNISVSRGICEDPVQEGNIYYYGDTFSDVDCIPLLENGDGRTIQCVMGENEDEMLWKGVAPECKGCCLSPDELVYMKWFLFGVHSY